MKIFGGKVLPKIFSFRGFRFCKTYAKYSEIFAKTVCEISPNAAIFRFRENGKRPFCVNPR
jgi:hypothetical protein